MGQTMAAAITRPPPRTSFTPTNMPKIKHQQAQQQQRQGPCRLLLDWIRLAFQSLGSQGRFPSSRRSPSDAQLLLRVAFRNYSHNMTLLLVLLHQFLRGLMKKDKEKQIRRAIRGADQSRPLYHALLTRHSSPSVP